MVRRQAEGLLLSRSPYVDGRHGIISDSYATPGNVHNSIVYLGRFTTASDNAFAVGLDAAYATSGIAQGLEQHTRSGCADAIGWVRR